MKGILNCGKRGLLNFLFLFYGRLSHWLAFCALTFGSGLSYAATYNLPADMGGAPFNTCALAAGTSYNCTGSITISSNDTINVTSPITLNLTTGSFTAGNSVTIISGVNSFTIKALVGSITFGNSFSANAVNLQAAAGTINIGNSASITGNLSANTINAGNNAAITGNLSATTLTLGNGTVVTGACTPTNAACTATRTLSVAAASVAEGNAGTTNLSFTVTLSASSGLASSASYTTTAGTATAGASCTAGVDYITTSGTVSIPAGSTTATITVQVCGDTTYEKDETFTVTLSAPTNATLGTSTATGTITNDDSPTLMAEYRMDESAWTAAAGQVVDSSGNGNHAQAFNSASTATATPAKSGSPGTCGYGVFDNGGTITRGYVQTPLPNLTTDFTVTAWIRTTNNTVGAQRILIDDQGTAPATGYGFSLGEAGTGKLRFFSRGITPVILDSTYVIANNTWYFVAAVADVTNKKRTIYVFNATGAFLNSITEAAWTGAWGTDGGPVSIGAETNASAETPAANHFKGNIDEVRVYQNALSQATLTAIAAQSHACPSVGPDHLEIQHASSTGLTCTASTLTIKACTDAAVPCLTPYTGGVSGTLSATGTPTVNWDGTTGGAAGAGFVISAGSSSVTKNVQVATAGSVVFGITSPSPVPTNATACNFGSPFCTFTASLAGFIFSDTTTGNSYTIPAQVSGIATPMLYLRAVQATTTNPAVCTPAIISQTTTSTMGYVCNNPATCQAGNLVTINATPITPAGASVSLTFDANGSAPITARYDDVGQVTLNANKTVTPFGGSTAVTLNGNSNPFVVAPHHFGFSGITAGPIKAGNNFSATVTAYNGLGTPAATKNFGREAAPGPEGVTLTSVLVSPAGGANPALGGNVIAGGSFMNGVASVSNLTWGEVGNITLNTALTSASYLGSGLNATGTSATVGVFIPDHLDTAVVATATSPIPCPVGLTCPTLYNGAVYSAQPFSVQVSTLNMAGMTTTNYDGLLGFSKNVTLAAWDALGSMTTQNPNGVLANNAIALASFSLGVATATTPTYSLTSATTAPTAIYLRAFDTDNVSSLRSPSSASIEGGVKVTSGRIKISNAYGSELLPLSMTATVQYFNGTSWLNSSTDNQTQFNTNLSTSGGNIVANIVSGLASGITVTTPAVVTVAGGVKTFTLNKPGVAGSVNINLNAPSYLPSNAARATFGIYRGNNSFIYLRETY